jgi:hypothetical protein
MDDNARDIAVSANQKVDSHIDDCVRFRQIVSKQYDEIRNDMNLISDKITSLQIKLATALGVLLFATKAVDYILAWHGAR